MTIYGFSLASMYEITGVDTAMCYRARIFKERGYDVKLIFITPPTVRDLQVYSGLGIEYEQMMGMHSFFTDINCFSPKADLWETASRLKEVLECTEEETTGNCLVLKEKNVKKAVLQLTEDKTSFFSIDYYDDEKQSVPVRTDYYADVLYASVFYEGEKGEISERLFYNRDGSIALRQIFRRGEEYDIFPDGSRYNNKQLFSLFIQRLKLTKDDMVILDRPLGLFSAKALFVYGDNINIVTVIHSEHYLLSGLSLTGINLNREYWYWFRCSRHIHTMIVGTEMQKQELIKTLKEFGFGIPNIHVIPPVCLDRLRGQQTTRKKKSIVCVARLDERKKIDWTIMAAVKAYELDEEITLDIYGESAKCNYIKFLEQLIKKYNASDYITLKGYMNVTEIYQNYKVFLTTSLWETFGITLLEAVGSGLPLVGLDVRYGNQQFIENGRNGYLVEYDPDHFYEECPTEVEKLADRIVEILSDEEKWKAFSRRSYEIAEQYLSEKVKEKWYELLPDRGKET